MAPYSPRNWRTWATAFGKIFRKDSTSPEVVPTPRVTRSELSARSGEIPIDSSTLEGFGSPVLQADPEEHANPSTSNFINNSLPFTSLNIKLQWLGSRCFG